MIRTAYFPRIALTALLLVGLLGGCSTAPKQQDQPDFLSKADSTTQRFEANVNGLRGQIQTSAAYIVFPNVARWGLMFGGGTFGRGAVYRPNGTQIGWAAINNQSIGLQAGVEGFRILMVLENERVLRDFMANKLTGSITGVVVVADAGDSGKASFTDGVAIYEGAASGLMGGINIGLDYIRLVSLAEG